MDILPKGVQLTTNHQVEDLIPHMSLEDDETILMQPEYEQEPHIEVEILVPERQDTSQIQAVRRNVPVKRNYKELRKLGATDFYGTVDPAEVESC